jgi:hypothetical protein
VPRHGEHSVQLEHLESEEQAKNTTLYKHLYELTFKTPGSAVTTARHQVQRYTGELMHSSVHT